MGSATMRLETGQYQKLDQRMYLAPRMIQSMEILQLPIMALQERIQQELQENPVLEQKEAGDDGPTADGEPEDIPDIAAEEKDPGDAELVVSEGDSELDFDRLEALSRDWDDHFNEEHRPSRNGMDDELDKKHDAMQNMASRPQSLQDYLNDQLAFLEESSEEKQLLRYVIAHIDDNGWLTGTIDDLAQNFERPVTSSMVEAALVAVQKLDPPGVGARNLSECLLLQLTPETPHRETLRVLIQNHLDDIYHNRLPQIQRRTGFDIASIKEAIEQLKHLNPKPGAQFTSESIPYVVPDIVIEKTEEGEYTVRLLDDWVPNIYISQKHINLYRDKSADATTKEFLKRKIQAATWLLESIEQRRNTLEKVTRAIIQHQKAFLDQGPEYIQPLKMQQIADQVGVHVTTVSRAVDDKWVQTPRGIFPLKRFFGGGTAMTLPEGSALGAEGEMVAWEVIKQKLLEIIGAEDKANPLSDEDLVTKLHDAGYPVARRTVTKYRKMLNIPSSRQRKDWALTGQTPSLPPIEEVIEPEAEPVPAV